MNPSHHRLATDSLMALAGLALLALPTLSSAASNHPDPRQSLGFTSEEQAIFLEDMRQMLGSVQQILRGIADDDREMIIAAAQRSGNRMARNTPESIRAKTPSEFRAIGGPMHMAFEEIAVRAEVDPLEDITAMTAEAMNQCMACHAQFRVD
ncbi:hypothetical protein LV475_02795 [Guyparkeria hydrothermalis]|uniref:hypothetical protein n=1 Tax=Guyparkeria TaxID=2035712 RepID=UPI0010ACF061|nr:MULTISPECIES: hypothetical protein [Guyparkeria]MCL7750530.1 hypothetical protein [Guyparkeria hydrothermalis]TKA88956.1 hypothetical protein FAZ79_07800 [Guyparkeria sp. SB14A]